MPAGLDKRPRAYPGRDPLRLARGPERMSEYEASTCIGMREDLEAWWPGMINSLFIVEGDMPRSVARGGCSIDTGTALDAMSLGGERGLLPESATTSVQCKYK